MQEESARLARAAEESASEVSRLRAEAGAALQDAQEALAREDDVQQLLQAADRVRLSPFPHPIPCWRMCATCRALGLACD